MLRNDFLSQTSSRNCGRKRVRRRMNLTEYEIFHARLSRRSWNHRKSLVERRMHWPWTRAESTWGNFIIRSKGEREWTRRRSARPTHDGEASRAVM